MPFILTEKTCSPLVVDYEYEVSNKTLLAQYVGDMLLGHHGHVLRILNRLSTIAPTPPNESIDSVINQITSASDAKRDGWLFQMISWLVLAKLHAGSDFHANYPHSAPAQHGLDGLAIKLKNDKTLDKIIITEDKCTSSPRNLITQQIFPEFKDFENHTKDNALIGIVTVLLRNLDAGSILQQVQNNIYDTRYRLYRIGITREEEHNDELGRRKLFKHYDSHVTGATAERRSAATIHIPNLRSWMKDFEGLVIAYLKTKRV
jgi:hypothetical protein